MTTLLLDAPGIRSTHLPADLALQALLRQLSQHRYQHVTSTPLTHARALAKLPKGNGRNLQDVFGWSRPFRREELSGMYLDLLQAADGLEPLDDGWCRSRYRVSSLAGNLFLHSAFPTDARDAVFLGPDSYRFADFVRVELSDCPQRLRARLVDIGTGAGIGAVVAGLLRPELELTMTDINPAALRLAGINARAAGIDVMSALGDTLASVDNAFDIALANPPYICDAAARDYRDGGDMHGARVAYDMADEVLDRLNPQGCFLLYTGSAIIGGHDPLREALDALVRRKGATMRYREIDPDVFGEELETAAYRDVERIAVVGAVITKDV